MGSEARARLGLAALLSVTLISFSMLFGQSDFSGPVILGMVAAGGIVVLMRRLGAGVPLTVLVSAGMLYWYLALVFQSSHTFYGLPTLATGRGLLKSLRFALDKSYIDYAPIPVRPGYVIMVITGMWIATTLGEIATFRLRRPLLASLFPTTLVIFLLVVGTGAGAQFYVVAFIAALLTYWALESAHRLRSWGRWMSTWSHLKGDAPTTIAGGIARRMGMSCVAAAIVAPLFLPYLGTGGIAWRNSTGEGPGGGSGQAGTAIRLLASITPQKIQQTTATLFTVRVSGVPSDSPVYWRLASLSRFDGEDWLGGEADGQPVSRDGEIPSSLPAPARRFTVPLEQEFQIVELSGKHLPAAVQPIDITYGRAENLEVMPATSDITMNPALAGGATYTVNSRLPSATYRELQQADTIDPGGSTVYRSLPDGTISPEVRDLLDSWIADATTPFERLIAIQSNLRDLSVFDYSLDVEPGASADALEEFLLETRKGYCQQFATAFAVLARELGYPTRVSIGFLPGLQDSNDPTLYTITGKDTHAWPEVYFEDLGWVPFEPTPRGVAVPPPYTSRSDQTELPGRQRPGGRDGGPAPGHRFADGTFADPFTSDDAGSDGAGGRAGDDSPAWRPAFTRLLLIVVVALLLWLVSVPALKSARIRRRYRAATSPRALVGAAFAEFRDEAAELATRQRPSESAVTFAERVASLGVVSRTAAARLARLYETAEYSTREVEANQADEARRVAAQLRASMWRAASLAQKARRLFSAAELLAARRPGRLRGLRPAATAGLARRV